MNTPASSPGRFNPAPFSAPKILQNGHAMTIFAALYPRQFTLAPAERREFHPEPETTLVAYCHWQPSKTHHKTVVLIHGLEGDADRHYMLGATAKALGAGFNVIRLNVRNCGGTEHLTPTLYHSGWTADLHFVLRELIERDHLPEIYLIGFSMGGNQVLKLGGELYTHAPAPLKGLVAVSPPIDLELCSLAIREKRNFIYQHRFLKSLKNRLRIKSKFYPRLYDREQLARVRTLWDFDEVVTAAIFGFRDARDYYRQASSAAYLPQIRVPTLIIQAQDDPFIPFHPFLKIAHNPDLALLAPSFGGHVGFWQPRSGGRDHYWGEQQAIDFCRSL